MIAIGDRLPGGLVVRAVGRPRVERLRDQRAAMRAGAAVEGRHLPAVRADLQALRDDADEAAIARAVERGDAGAAADAAVPREVLGDAAEPMVVDGLETGKASAAPFVPPRLRASVADLPEAVARAAERLRATERGARWAKGHAAKLITEVTAETKAAVRESVARGIAAGRHPRQVAKQVREVVGLHSRQAAAVDRMFARQLAEGVPFATAEKRAAKYAERLRTQRAELIARTETTRAISRGRADLWEDLVDRGAVRRRAVRREWMAVPDERAEERCTRLDGKTAGLDASFPGGYHEPPDPHAGCRCTVVYEEA